MKLIVRTGVLCLTVLMLLLSFAGCAGREEVIEAYNQAGYNTAEYSTANAKELQQYSKYIPDALKEQNSEIECRYFMADKRNPEKGKENETLSASIIVKFESEDAIKAALGEPVYQEQQNLRNIRGSWLYISIIDKEKEKDEKTEDLAKPIFEKYTIFEPTSFIDNAIYMGAGMLGIFVVIGLIIIATTILNSATTSKKKD